MATSDELDFAAPGTDETSFVATHEGAIITSCRLRATPSHDIVRVWNRHGLAGELVVVKGDGVRVVERLMNTPGPA